MYSGHMTRLRSFGIRLYLCNANKLHSDVTPRVTQFWIKYLDFFF